MRAAVYDVLRPIYGPITRNLRRRLGQNYAAHPEMELPPPYEAIQLDVERNLHKYLHCSRDCISQIVIVGAHEAEELDRLRMNFPRSKFLCFEPNPPSFERLVQKFGNFSEIKLSQLALSDKRGTAKFFEPELPGNGSLLQPDLKRWALNNQTIEGQVGSFDVTLSTLDEEAKDISVIDLLWMDVQGAEGLVLRGAEQTLPRTRAIFMEVALVQSPYKGAVLFPELEALLHRLNFMCVGLGIDGWNGAGNAIFLKDFGKLALKPVTDGTDQRSATA
jgi:FkbM family methyltransferase